MHIRKEKWEITLRKFPSVIKTQKVAGSFVTIHQFSWFCFVYLKRKPMSIEYNLIFVTMVSRVHTQEPHVISVILHHQEEMERFPLSLVTDPTAVTNDDRRDVYNNVVLFTVVEDPHRRAPSEMHIFQSISNPVSLSSNYYYFFLVSHCE